MAKKKIKKLFSFAVTPKTRVRNSYYTFSKQYPAGNLHIDHTHSKSKRSPKATLVLKVLLFVVLTTLSFFTVRLMLDISYKQPDESTVQSENAQESFIQTDGVRALYMPYTKLGDEKYIKSFVSRIRRKNADCVVIDFKTQQGKLAYTSLHDYAIAGKCAMFDNDTVRRAIDIFEQYNIKIIAEIYCFEDAAVSAIKSEIAVKYMDTQVNWLDSDGNSWLNPCSKRTRNYIINVIKELSSMGIRGFILQSVYFPDDTNTSGASYPGIKSYKSKNNVLTSFIEDVRKALPKDSFVLLGQSATDVLSQENGPYQGSMASCQADGFAVNTKIRPESYIIDKKTDFASALSLLGNLGSINAKKYFVPIIDFSEYSGAYLRQIKKAGYQSFILYDEKGEY